MKSDEYAEVAEKWDSHYNAHPVTAAEDRLITSVVRRLYRPGMRVLDIGCGTGMVLENVMILPADYLGVDVSPSMLNVARRKFPLHTFMVDDAEELATIPDAAIDFGMYLFGVFPFTKPEPSLRQMARVLKPGAPFMVTFYHIGFPMGGDDGYQAAFYANNLQPPVADFHTVSGARSLFKPFPSLMLIEVVTINSYLGKVERVIPRPLRMSALRRYARFESFVMSRVAPEFCHHFVLVGRKDGSAVS